MNDNIYFTLKSLYRYHLFKTEKYPDILLEKEEEILSERLSKCNIDEIYYIVTNWNDWSFNYKIETELNDIVLFKTIDKEIKEIN